jgi:hypothetical protein
MKIIFLIYTGQLTVSRELNVEVLNQNVSRMTETFTRNIDNKISCIPFTAEILDVICCVRVETHDISKGVTTNCE